MKHIIFLFLCFGFHLGFSQIKGTVTDPNNEPLAFVNIYMENQNRGTTTNENGEYVFELNNQGGTLVFQYLGYKTEKRIIATENHPTTLNVQLTPESFVLAEVVLSNTENPANGIIRNAIAHKKINTEKTDKFEADFYSKGLFHVANMPERILGFEIGDLDGNIDSTRAGIVYQSETISKIKVQKPNKLSEHIIASKVAGDSQGYSFNSAQDADFDFYDNHVAFSLPMISPIADKAFTYYRYVLESTFYDENKNLINKIKIIPKRDKEPVFEGYIYIVEDSWAIYGLALTVKGYRMQEPMLNQLLLTQNFNFNKTHNLWIKNLQTIDFEAGFIGINFNGKFSHVYSNHHFINQFKKEDFTNEIVRFADDSNTKDSLYWNLKRQIPLTAEEVKNYTRKDSIETLRNSKVYLDSIDRGDNKFKLFDIVSGYTYKNSFAKKQYTYDGLLNLSSLPFNTVQGWTLGTGISYSKQNKKTLGYTHISGDFQYGFAEKRLRPKLQYTKLFNQKNKAYFIASAGSQVNQFNEDNPISPFVNSISTLFFKNNFMKVYQKEFLNFTYGQELVNGLYFRGSLAYEYRKPLWNNTDYTIMGKDKPYTSNNPILPDDNTIAAFEPHRLFKSTWLLRYFFNQKYVSLPNQKLVMPDDDYPSLSLIYINGFSADSNDYQFQYIGGKVEYQYLFDNKGNFNTNISAGTFFNVKNISFVDYKHFNGNRTHLQFQQKFNNSFYLLPYYTHSTDAKFLEAHAQYNFKGFLMNKIPLLNKLQWNFVVGFHQLSQPNHQPYREFTLGFDNIGFGKFRLLRIDYVRAYENGYIGDGLMFGIKL